MRKLIEDYIFIKMEDLSPNFWIEFNQEYFISIYNLLFSLEAFFNEYYGMTEKEYKEIILAIETDLYINTKKDFLKKVFDLHLIAYDIFRKNFWYNEGMPRIWNKSEEIEISQLKTKFLQDTEFIFKIFNKFKILKNPLKCIYKY